MTNPVGFHRLPDQKTNARVVVAFHCLLLVPCRSSLAPSVVLVKVELESTSFLPRAFTLEVVTPTCATASCWSNCPSSLSCSLAGFSLILDTLFKVASLGSSFFCGTSPNCGYPFPLHFYEQSLATWHLPPQL